MSSKSSRSVVVVVMRQRVFFEKGMGQIDRAYVRALALDPDVLRHSNREGSVLEPTSVEDRAHFSYLFPRSMRNKDWLTFRWNTCAALPRKVTDRSAKHTRMPPSTIYARIPASFNC
jgi:hypothetical protein